MSVLPWYSISCFLFVTRKRTVIVNRGPLIENDVTGEVEFNQSSCFQGRAIDRVYPGGKELFADVQ